LRHLRAEPTSLSAEDEYLAELEPADHTLEKLHDALKYLTARQRFVIECRYGMRGNETVHTLQDIASLMGVTHQTVSEHEQIGIKTLQKHLLSTS